MFTNKLANYWGPIQCVLGPIMGADSMHIGADFLNLFLSTKKGDIVKDPMKSIPFLPKKCSRVGVCHVGVGCVMQGWGGVCHIGWGGVCHVGVRWSVWHTPPPPLYDTSHPTPTWHTPPLHAWQTPPLNDRPHPQNIFGKKWDGFHGVLHYVSLLLDKNRFGKSAPICIESAPIIGARCLPFVRQK